MFKANDNQEHLQCVDETRENDSIDITQLWKIVPQNLLEERISDTAKFKLKR